MGKLQSGKLHNAQTSCYNSVHGCGFIDNDEGMLKCQGKRLSDPPVLGVRFWD